MSAMLLVGEVCRGSNPFARTISASEKRYRRPFDRHHREVYAYCRRRTEARTAVDCFAFADHPMP